MARIGFVARVAGVVVDAEFPSGDLPGIYNALRIEQDDALPLIVEVQEHINPFIVRGIAMSNTSGLQRGLRAMDTGGHICVPVGLATQGRMFNVLGQPVDGGLALECAELHPTHADAPAL